MDCPVCPNGVLEATTKVYLDVDAHLNENGDVIIDGFAVSHLNDMLDGMPVNVEAELHISCSECGHDFDDAEFSIPLKNRIGLQPIGDAPRTLGRRGGRSDE